MRIRVVASIFGVFVTIAVVALAIRVRQLEQTVESLTQQRQSSPHVIYMPAIGPATTEHPKERKIFKLLDSAGSNESTTAVGVPWSVEQAIMIDTTKPTRRIER